MSEEEEMQELSILASTKDRDAIDGEADDSCCNEDPDDGDFHSVLERIEKHLSKKKSVWAVQMYEPGETSADYDTGLFYFFIDTSFDNVKKRIEELPNLLTAAEVLEMEKQIKEMLPGVGKITNSEDLVRGVNVDIPHEVYQSLCTKCVRKIGDVKIGYRIGAEKKQRGNKWV